MARWRKTLRKKIGNNNKWRIIRKLKKYKKLRRRKRKDDQG